jgi:hypothetical protein
MNAVLSFLQRIVVLPLLLAVSSAAFGQGFSGVFTWHNDNSRTGQNLNETTLTPQNVNVATFGKVFSYPVDGMAYAQPLYVPNVTVPNQGTHNVIYVATENDSVYAFDADGLQTSPLWHVSFLDLPNGVTTVPCADESSDCNVYPVYGITSTPVIDPTTGTLYAVARTKESGTWVQRIHALDITSGVEKFGGPVVIQATVNGTGNGSQGGKLPFNARLANQRPALLLSNNTLYVGWTGVHGWVMAFDPQTLALLNAFTSTPNSQQHGGIWMAGGGMAADNLGNVYFSVAEAGFDINQGGEDWGETLLKVSPTLQVLDYFSPSDQVCRVTNDYDLASGGPLLLPPQSGSYPNEIIQAGKGGYPCDPFGSGWGVPVYLVNRDSMGGYNSQVDTSLQTVLGVPILQQNVSGGYWGNAAYFQSPSGQFIYLSGLSGEVGKGDNLKAFSLTNGVLSTAPVAKSTNILPIGSTPSVSAYGSSDGIVWAVERQDILAAKPGNKPAVLYAYDANNVATMLYNSTLAGTRDQAGPGVKFVTPTVANGKVYVGTQTELDVYGLLGQSLPAPAIKLSPASLSFGNQLTGSTSLQQSVTLTNSGTASLQISNVGASGDFLLNNTATSCPYSGGFVNAGATCTLDAAFTPSQLGSRTGSITITSNSAGGPNNAGLSGIGTNPTVSVFLQPSSAQVGNGPQAVAVADFNGDGYADVAVANATDGTVSILLNNGNGTFTLKSTIATGSGSAAVVAADFLGNGKQDLAIANQTGNTVSILLGNGDGTFTAATTLTGFSGPGSLVSADFNNDGRYDLAVANASNGTVSIFLSNGNGTFTAQSALTLPSSVPSAIAAADFNGDGNQDLIVADSANSVLSIFLGNGSGGFTLKSSPAVSGSPVAIAVGDWNGDKKVDLAVVNVTAGTMSTLFGNGDGTFQSAVNYTGLAAPKGIATADFNGDGNPDLAVTNSSANTVDIFLGSANGSFQSPTAYSTGSAPYGLAAKDFNNDGWPDLVVANSAGNTVSILLQSAQATLSSASLALGEQIVGTAGPSQDVVLSNSGDAALTINSVIIGGANPGDFGFTSSCTPLPVKVLAGSECRFGVSFKPTAIGIRAASLLISDTAGSGSQTVALTGTGTQPVVSLSSSTLNVGNVVVGASGTGSLLLANTGSAPLTFTSVVASGDYSMLPATTACPYGAGVLNAGASCTLDVTFTPSATGTRTGNITITDNAAGGSQAVSLTGTGTVATIGLFPVALAFGAETLHVTTPPQTLTVSNTSAAAAGITVSITGADPGDYAQTNNCPASLAGNSSCTVQVTFTPQAAGARTANLSIAETGSSTPITAALSGSGAAPTVKLVPASIAFGSQTVGTTSATHTVTLTNSGNATLTISSISVSGGNAGDFAQTNTCGSSVVAKASCTISVTFTPTKKGTRNSAVVVLDNAGSGQQKAVLTGVGD